MRGFTLIFPSHTKVFCGVNSVICIDLLLKMRLYVPIKLYLLQNMEFFNFMLPSYNAPCAVYELSFKENLQSYILHYWQQLSRLSQ